MTYTTRCALDVHRGHTILTDDHGWETVTHREIGVGHVWLHTDHTHVEYRNSDKITVKDE